MTGQCPFIKTCLKIFYPYKFYLFRTKSTKKPVASPRRRGGGGSTPAGADPPATCEISPGADTTIEITKDKDEDGKPMGLGLSIVGGSDTLLGAIFIHEVSQSPMFVVNPLSGLIFDRFSARRPS